MTFSLGSAIATRSKSRTIESCRVSSPISNPLLLRMPSPSNTAAWLTAELATPLEIKEAPYISPKDNEILIKNGAVAINPVDWAIQALGSRLFPWLKYPIVLGSDVAGEVVEVGRSVTRFQAGDRVLGFAIGIKPNEPNTSQGAFQTYTTLQSNLSAPIPSTMSYEDASVIPMGVSVAACALFQKDYLALEYPSIPPKPTGKTILIWGGSTSIGCNTIQLAVSAGYEVISTSSPKNFDYVKKLGASQVFDYSSPTVVSDLVEAFKGKYCVGAVAIGSALTTATSGLNEACVEIVAKLEGVKFVAMAQQVPKGLPSGVEAKFIDSHALEYNEVGKFIYEDYLPKALAGGRYVATPDALVVGKGLECIQEAFDVQKKGVSAKKVVVSL